jgi:hypothetical protein
MSYTDICNGACNLLRYANFKACANLVGVNSQLCFLAFLWSIPSLFMFRCVIQYQCSLLITAHILVAETQFCSYLCMTSMMNSLCI